MPETSSPRFLSTHVSRGPSQDAPQFKPAARAATRRCPLDTLRGVAGDAADAAEYHHADGRGRLRIRSTVFALNRRSTGRKLPKTPLRRPRVRRFRKKPKGSRSRRGYGQRWQIESGFARHKRLLGSALRARKWANQKEGNPPAHVDP